jgi:hypothetical protein
MNYECVYFAFRLLQLPQSRCILFYTEFVRRYGIHECETELSNLKSGYQHGARSPKTVESFAWFTYERFSHLKVQKILLLFGSFWITLPFEVYGEFFTR